MRWLILIVLLSATPCLAQSREVAFVDITAFEHPQNGIKRLVEAAGLVEKEFAPRRAELLEFHMRAQERLKQFAFSGPIPTDPEPMTPERREALKQRAEAIRLSVRRKHREMDGEYRGRMKEATAPIREDIRRSLEEFARSRGIKMLFDASETSCCAGDCGERSKWDVTREFIEEYNRLNR